MPGLPDVTWTSAVLWLTTRELPLVISRLHVILHIFWWDDWWAVLVCFWLQHIEYLILVCFHFFDSWSIKGVEVYIYHGPSMCIMFLTCLRCAILQDLLLYVMYRGPSPYFHHIIHMLFIDQSRSIDVCRFSNPYSPYHPPTNPSPPGTLFVNIS